jgi:hypothetical protein
LQLAAAAARHRLQQVHTAHAHQQHVTALLHGAIWL